MAAPHHFFFEPVQSRRVDFLLSDPFLAETRRKWGLHRKTRLCAFRFERSQLAPHSGAQASTGALRFSGFHAGLLPEFLAALFSTTALREALGLRAVERSAADGVRCGVLGCAWTTLEPFARLAAAGVVRRVEEKREEEKREKKEEEEEEQAAAFDGGVRMPVVKRAETYLPHDIAIADELRALFLLAHNNARRRDEFDNGGEEEEEEEEWSAFGYGTGAGLSMATLRHIFTEAERSEFLYHILWRLVAGGGSNNQWEDDLTTYLEAARKWYKNLVAIRACVSSEAASLGKCMHEVDRAAEVDGGVLTPEVVSTVVAVHAVGGLALFDRTDDAEPRNLNYCYVCIDPTEAEVIVWHHSF